MESLHCDECHVRIGWVEEFDLNGSKFYCAACADPVLVREAELSDAASAARGAEIAENAKQLADIPARVAAAREADYVAEYKRLHPVEFWIWLLSDQEIYDRWATANPS